MTDHQDTADAAARRAASRAAAAADDYRAAIDVAVAVHADYHAAAAAAADYRAAVADADAHQTGQEKS